MTLPSDVRELLALLPDMGVEPAIVEKVRVHLQADPGQVNRWGGVLVDFRTVGKFRAADVVAATAVLKARGVVFVDRGTVQPSDKGALTQGYLGAISFELVHSHIQGAAGSAA